MTSTALVPMAELDRYADAFSRSGLFGAKTKDQALSLLLLAHAEGVHPAIAMRDYDIINGRPAKKAEAMHRAFLAAGGKIEWHRLDDQIADATFSHPAGGTARITWDLTRAKKAGIGGKDMYSKYTRQMLRSRTISEGCRTVYPASTGGLYVPEEVRHFEAPAYTPAQQERDMGPAPVVEDEDITQQIPGAGNASPDASPAPQPPSPSSPIAAEAAFISVDQATDLRDKLIACDKDAEPTFLRIAKIAKIEELPAADYPEALDWIGRRAKKIGKAP